MRITTFGAGYVGLVTGTCLAEIGHDMLVVDVDPAKIQRLEKGETPFYEPGLADLVRRNVAAGRLRFATKADEGPFNTPSIYFIAVGTPPKDDGDADLTAVFSVAEKIGAVAHGPALVVVKSTVPLGTCDALQEKLPSHLDVVSNPEFLKEGAALEDFFHPDRIVVGARTEAAFEMMRKLYAPLQLVGESVITTDRRSSELIKYASNTMLATRVSFMNELSRLCHAAGANIHDVRRGVGSDTRIGKRFLYAGPGYGGSCFPKDVQALIHLAHKHSVAARVAEATHLANEEQAEFLAGLVDKITGDLTGKTVALWGLAFKPETDDVRESPAIKMARVLLKKGAKIVGHDPEAGGNFLREVPEARVVGRQYDALDGACALILLTEWRCYRAPDFDDMRTRMVSYTGSAPVVVDARNIWTPHDVLEAGLIYQGIGVNR